ncbi:hypothetical protein [Variovorax ginsengisoli]|uniref:Uncharacterized protein n=1 Tax=Variovorax ginsengisoli TaxID=363844 RepID=A0ABT9SEY6_9BURK|nr:hypothetical protein [Variovorax ginsengisoli]MDP9902924.1 hypothetical protein [Variovorax ginsengisoli]
MSTSPDRPQAIMMDQQGNLTSLFGRPMNMGSSDSPAPANDSSDNRAMAEMTREELNAKLELVQERNDSRLSLFEQRMDNALAEMRGDRADLKDDIRGLQSDIKSFRVHIISTVVVTGIAVISGVAAFNATVLSNMVASFESGKNTAQLIGDATKRLEVLQDRIEAAQSNRQAPTGTTVQPQAK